MTSKLRKIGRFVITKGKFVLMLVGVLILAMLVKKVSPGKVVEIVGSMDPVYIFIAVIPWTLALLAGTYRLKRFIKADIIFFEIFKIYCYGFLLNYASPIQGFGAGAKIGMLRMKKVSLPKSSASISLEILYDILLTSCVAVIFFFYHIEFVLNQLKTVTNLYLISFAITIIFILFLLILIFRKNRYIIEYFQQIIECFSIRNILRFLPITFFIWLMSSITVFFFFKALGIDINLWIIFAGLAIAFLLGLVSFIPGGLGVRDVAVSYIYSLSGILLETTISIALFSRIFGIITVAVLSAFTKIYDLYLNKFRTTPFTD